MRHAADSVLLSTVLDEVFCIVWCVHATTTQGCKLNLGGRLRIAREGFNATVSGTHAGVRAFAAALQQFDAAAFQNTDFKYIDGLELSQV